MGDCYRFYKARMVKLFKHCQTPVPCVLYLVKLPNGIFANQSGVTLVVIASAVPMLLDQLKQMADTTL